MKTNVRFLLSATTGLGLAAFTILSAFTAGANAPATVIAFSLLAIYGLLEIAILSYASPRFEVRPAAVRAMSLRSSASVRVSTLVELPVCCSERRAA